jgi:CubicO group peptidase (beta-lactamase class C family)
MIAAKARASDAPYNAILRAHFQSAKIAGLQACVIEDGNPAWSGAFGFADLRRRIAMTADTVINIASVSKTVTACAVMQLWEQRRLGLDEDISRWLPFPVRNPRQASTAITARHLLTHTSSIADGPAYAQSYSCGSPTAALRDWISEYVRPGGRYYGTENFHPWAPGERFQYSNVGFGLLGFAVEAVSGRPFSSYCDREIFQPLGMQFSSFGAAKVPSRRQAIPYTTASGGQPGERVVSDDYGAPLQWNGTSYIANCLYSFPNVPDGMVRTSVAEFSRFVSAILCGGEFNGHRILQPATLGEMFREQFPKALRPPSWPAVQGLAWYAIRAPDSNLIWLHTGADPGVRTVVMCYPPRRSAVLLFANTAPAEGLDELAGACLREAVRSSATRR